MTAVARYFDAHARAFDRRYEASGLATRFLRGGPLRGRDLAVAVVARHPAAAVLDLGCGSGRVAEAVLTAGAAEYVGVDVSSQMLALARGRLARFERVELVEGDFLRLRIPRTFDVVLALGVFEYLEQPARALEWIRARCSSTFVASFTRWDLLKGPLRHLHYALHGCPVADFGERATATLLLDAGFERVEFPFRGRRGFLVTARAAGS
jgi:SAM-dependent methyltransferase